MQPSRYSIELYTPSGQQTADLSGIAKNRRFRLSRNNADQISFDLDLFEIERYAHSINTTAVQLIQPGITEVRVRRLGNYLVGGQVGPVNPLMDSTSQNMPVNVIGFLDLFKDRMTSNLRIFTNVQRTTIAWTLINESQSQGADWDFGITQGTLVTLPETYSRKYQNVPIRSGLKDLTELQLAFDMEITPDKVFNTYVAIGSIRPEIEFQYPGNIKRIGAPIDPSNIANQLYLLGSGIGQSAQTYLPSGDAGSQANYKVREKSVILSDVLDSGTLADYGHRELESWKSPLQVPTINFVAGVNGAPQTTDIHIGDYVGAYAHSGSSFIDSINGLYRIETIDIQPDGNDVENVALGLGK